MNQYFIAKCVAQPEIVPYTMFCIRCTGNKYNMTLYSAGLDVKLESMTGINDSTSHRAY